MTPARREIPRERGRLGARAGPHLDFRTTPRVAASCPTPPGPEGSKGKRALSGTRGAFSSPARGRRPAPRRATGCRRRWLGFTRGVPPRVVPPLPARDLRGGHRAGARHRAAARGAGEQPGQPRLPLLRTARLRQDDLGPDPGPRAELRAGARSPTPAASATAAATSPAAGPAPSTSSRSTRRPTAASTTPATCARRRSSPRCAASTRSTSSTRRTWSRRRASTPCSSWSRSRRRTCASSSPPPSPRRCCRRSGRARTTTRSG